MLAGAVFYAMNQGIYLMILILSIGINYGLCRLWAYSGRKIYVNLAIVFNISLLGLFKYIPAILQLGHNAEGTLLQRIVIPIGLSFFSFQAMGYILDVYWSNKKKIVRLDEYALYMSFFPQLLSGPIARSKDFLPQINKEKKFDYDNIVSGLRRILWGIFKKVVIANNISPYTDSVFQNPNLHMGFTLIVTAIAFILQIYMDFSGYTDIVLGSAKVLGFDLMENFRTPLFARSVTDFWRRWHISLSSWVRDYVYMPLQFQTRAWGRTGLILATMVTFLIIGVWHKANWTLVIFGLLQGIAICWEFLSTNLRAKIWSAIPQWLGNALSNLLVFIFVAFSAIFLKADSLADAIHLFSHVNLDIASTYIGSRQSLVFSLLGLIVVFGVELRNGDMMFSTILSRQSVWLRWCIYIMLIFSTVLIGSLDNENFIYYQF